MTISESLKKEIRKQYLETNLTLTELATVNKVSRSSVLRICNNNEILSRRNNPNWKSKQFIELNETYFEIINSKDKAYWLGFIAADGWLSKDDTYPRVIIGLSLKDLNHLEKFKTAIESVGKITKCKVLHKATNKYHENCSISINRFKFRNDLINKGITPNKSKELSLPNLPDELMRHYIRGYFDGDGCWTIRSNIMMCCSFISSVESFAIEMRKYLSNICDLNNSVKITHYNNAYAFVYAGNLQCKRIYDYLYEDGGPWLDRKYEKSTEHFLKLSN